MTSVTQRNKQRQATVAVQPTTNTLVLERRITELTQENRRLIKDNNEAWSKVVAEQLRRQSAEYALKYRHTKTQAIHVALGITVVIGLIILAL